MSILRRALPLFVFASLREITISGIRAMRNGSSSNGPKVTRSRSNTGFHLAGNDSLARSRCHDQAEVADRTGLSRAQAGTGPWPLRGPRLARIPPPRQSLHRGLRVSPLRTGDDFPLSTCPFPKQRKTSRSPRFPIRDGHPSGPNVTPQIRSRRCVGNLLSPSLED